MDEMWPKPKPSLIVISEETQGAQAPGPGGARDEGEPTRCARNTTSVVVAFVVPPHRNDWGPFIVFGVFLTSWVFLQVYAFFLCVRLPCEPSCIDPIQLRKGTLEFMKEANPSGQPPGPHTQQPTSMQALC